MVLVDNPEEPSMRTTLWSPERCARMKAMMSALVTRTRSSPRLTSINCTAMSGRSRGGYQAGGRGGPRELPDASAEVCS